MWVEKNGPNWRIRDLVAGRKVTVESGYATKTAAKKAMVLLEADRLKGEFIDPRGGRTTLEEWTAVFWPAHEISLRPSSRKSEGARVRNHILPLLGEYRLDELTPLIIKSWVSLLLSGDEEMDRYPLAEKTIRNVHGVLYSILQGAVEERMIRKNPCYRTGLPKVEFREQRYLDEAEIGRLVASMPAYWRPLVILLVATGLRWSEAAGLKVKRVDILACKLFVEETLHEISPSQPLVTGPPKTEQSRRAVSFPQDVAELLVPSVTMRPRDAYVFVGPDGGPVHYRKFWRLFVKHAALAGLVGLRIHDLRHTHAAHLISDGVPLTGVQRRFGHSSITVTSDMYGHLLPVVDENIIAATEASLAMIDFRGILGEPGGEQPETTSIDEEEPAGQSG
jgi:integrase